MKNSDFLHEFHEHHEIFENKTLYQKFKNSDIFATKLLFCKKLIHTESK